MRTCDQVGKQLRITRYSQSTIHCKPLLQEYIRSCRHVLPVIRLPHDEIGIGYTRHWIMKIATQVGLKFIWMVNDSVTVFCEYDPDCEGSGFDV